MSGLHELARLVLDHRLSVLREVADRRDQSKAQIAALNLDPGSSDLAPAQAGQVAFRYQLWADVRRAELNSLLSRQTAEWLAARDEARVALGRTDALRALAGRQNGRK
jgi:hypothetical protein